MLHEAAAVTLQELVESPDEGFLPTDNVAEIRGITKIEWDFTSSAKKLYFHIWKMAAWKLILSRCLRRSALSRDAYNQCNHNQAIDFDSYKIIAPDSD